MNFVGYYTVPGGEGTSFNEKWVRDVSVEEVQACYSGFEPEIQALLKVNSKLLPLLAIAKTSCNDCLSHECSASIKYLPGPCISWMMFLEV